MDFIDRIREIAARTEKHLDYYTTEEATKTALIMPFISALGYDVFNPMEVMPEFTADVGTKKGEKVDYAIIQGDAPVMLFECKWSGADLNKEHASQLHRYFNVVQNVRFGVLTNGVTYEFYSDLDSPNVMDSKPFFTFDLFDFQDRHIAELKKFTKSTFDLENILATASELKYTAALRRVIAEDFEEPSGDYVEYLARQVYSGRLTQQVRDQFSIITKKALRRYLNDQINERLQSALSETKRQEATEPELVEVRVEEDEELDDSVVRVDKAKGIVTTEDEIEGLFAVKSILRDVIDVRRVHMRDTKSYCGILLDNNNRKPLCRLRFNADQKYLGIFDDQKNEEKIPIEDVEDIYQHADHIKSMVEVYES